MKHGMKSATVSPGAYASLAVPARLMSACSMGLRTGPPRTAEKRRRRRASVRPRRKEAKSDAPFHHPRDRRAFVVRFYMRARDAIRRRDTTRESGRSLLAALGLVGDHVARRVADRLRRVEDEWSEGHVSDG